MHELEAEAQQLQQEVTAALAHLRFDDLVEQKSQLDTQVSAPGFWNDAQQAQEIVKQQAKLEKRVAPWHDLKKECGRPCGADRAERRVYDQRFK